MEPPQIAALEWDEENLEHMRTRHRLNRGTVREVLDGAPLFRANLAETAATTHQMVGPDQRGRVWVVCMFERVEKPGQWRVVTGWPADEEDREWYKNNKKFSERGAGR